VFKLTEDLASFKNKITLQNKSTEITNLLKVNVALTSEKTLSLDDISTFKQFNNETNNKLQCMNDLHKKSEVEKTSLKNQIEKQLIEIEKKNAEIENLKKQVDQANTERNMLKEELLNLLKTKNQPEPKFQV